MIMLIIVTLNKLRKVTKKVAYEQIKPNLINREQAKSAFRGEISEP